MGYVVRARVVGVESDGIFTSSWSISLAARSEVKCQNYRSFSHPWHSSQGKYSFCLFYNPYNSMCCLLIYTLLFLMIKSVNDLQTPMDGLRLVFPPLPAAFIITFFYFFYKALLPWPVFCAFASGKLFGYICYDVIHYHLHHGTPPPNSNYHYRKVYHHNHHYKDGDSGMFMLL